MFDFATYGEEILRLNRMTAYLLTMQMHDNSGRQPGPRKFNELFQI